MKKITLELTDEQIESLKDQGIIEKKGPWKPEKGEKYWYLHDFGIINIRWFDRGDIFGKHLARNNVYRTEAEAKLADDKRIALATINRFIEENCEVVTKEDWIERSQSNLFNWYPYVDAREILDLTGTTSYSVQPFPYLKTKEDCNKLIKACESELKLLLGV